MKRLLIALVLLVGVAGFSAPAMAQCGYGGGYYGGYGGYGGPSFYQPYYYNPYFRPYSYYRPSVGLQLNIGGYGGYGGYGHHHHHHHH
jgi:hypothetical protein